MTYDGLARTPGIGTERTFQHRKVLYSPEGTIRLPHIGVIDASESRDPGNTGHVSTLRPGLLMGKITASKLWAPSIVGALAEAYTSGGTTLAVTAAQAVELARLVGQAGTNELVCIGAPTATGTIAVTVFTHSAIDTTTGDITVNSLGVNKHAGSWIAVNDGRYTPLGILDEGYGQKMTDVDGNDVDSQLQRLLVGGFIDTAQIINFPASANTSLNAWLKANIKGQYLWSDEYTA